MLSTPLPSILQPEALFQAGGSLAVVGWLALAVAPASARWAVQARFLAGRILPGLLAVPYLLLFASQGLGDGGYGSLAEVQRLFANPALLTAGWLHYLAFDLFVGAWIAERAARLGWPHLLALPLLALTFLFGPAGLLAFFAVHALRRRRHPATAPA
jgi:hypothetical protein